MGHSGQAAPCVRWRPKGAAAPSRCELREYVVQEKRLPNVPNAREIKEQGLNLSQFQMRLLEKVEELTLYALAQDELLTVHREEIQRLREHDAALQERLTALEGVASVYP